MKVTIKTGIICDDIRLEDNGKLIIIGTYAGTIADRLILLGGSAR